MRKKSNININEVTQQLQQIDYSQLLKILQPIIIFFVSSKITNSCTKIYRLNREFKAKANHIVDLPPQITRIHSEVDKERILKQKFGDSIINFVTIMLEKQPDIDLNLFFNNLGTLTTSTKNFKFSNIFLRVGTQGAYNQIKNAIELQDDNYTLTIDHELFHMSSSYYRESDGMVFTGFEQYPKDKNPIAKGINEGYTQLLTERYFGETKKVLKAYQYEKKIATTLEMIIGKEKMEKLYLNASLYGLVEELLQYVNEEVIMQFFTDIDFLGTHLADKNYLQMEKSMIINKLKSVNQFLLVCYVKKLIIDFGGFDLNEEILRENLATFISNMGATFLNGKKRFDILDIDEINKIIQNTFNDFKNNNAENETEQQIDQFYIIKGK